MNNNMLEGISLNSEVFWLEIEELTFFTNLYYNTLTQC